MTTLPDDDAAVPEPPAEGVGPARAEPRRRRRRAVALTALAALVVGGLLAGAAVAFSRGVTSTAGEVEFTRPLAIPPLASSTVQDGVRVFTLDMQEGETDLGQGGLAPTLGVNGSFLGPTLRATRGEQVRIDVTNSMSETSTLHWHGMKLPAVMDGGPHQQVEPGRTWSPTWTVAQPAATLWYHPHLHGRTADHVYRGLAGLFVLDEPAGSPEAAVQDALPHEYGVDDVPLVVQDKKFHADGRLDDADPFLSSTGVRGSVVLVNGTADPYLDVTTERVRLRVLNGSNARIYSFGFDDGRDFQVVGSDGGLLEAPVTTDRLRLTPGDRAEVVVEVEPGERTVLRSFPQELGVNPFTARFSGGDDTLDVLELRAAPTLEPSAPVPTTLAGIPSADEGAATTTRRFELSGTSINGQDMDLRRIDEVVDAGATEVWEVTSLDDSPHNFHVHDAQFQVLDVAGEPPPLDLRGWQDTVYVRPGKVTRLLVTFGTTPDAEHPYMFHCHLLRHEDQGMMGQFVVVDPSAAPGTAGRPAPGDLLPGVSGGVGQEGGHGDTHADDAPRGGTGPRLPAQGHATARGHG
ncbi:multicopper oxidase domain-containing protein [Oerskovia sp. Sa1BUA8]|uniref:Multicopper oxidase domain-containing protein n=1 Tax=Oerskovia douganii TaxID=2762210 RepID=A0A9D5UEZ1_9CELL|nr:multicopper oxidase domain-containing protein [Oerskovia douganii]MBE7701811.1 multicopper oxidase domain-containing protein [Oerskovia douganii]